MTVSFLCSIALFLTAIPGFAGTTIYTCQDPVRGVLLQDVPCTGTTIATYPPPHAPAPRVADDRVDPRITQQPALACSFTTGGSPCTYSIPGLPGVSLEMLVFAIESWDAATVKGTLRNASPYPLQDFSLVVEWFAYGAIQDTTPLFGGSALYFLPPGGAVAVQAYTMHRSAIRTENYAIWARWGRQPQLVRLVRQP